MGSAHKVQRAEAESEVRIQRTEGRAKPCKEGSLVSAGLEPHSSYPMTQLPPRPRPKEQGLGPLRSRALSSRGRPTVEGGCVRPLGRWAS